MITIEKIDLGTDETTICSSNENKEITMKASFCQK
jgi:hypothetical protein